MPFCSNNDSINFWIEPFLGGKMLFFGLAYLPVIPNFLLPFTYPHEAKKVNEYHIMLAFSKYDFIDVEDIGFYRNGEKIVPESIDLIEFDNERFPNEYNIKSTLRNDLPNYKMYPNNYYLFTFKIKTFTTKKIEIRLVNNPLLVINRKKEILHEIIFTH
ncbi:MAG: hypothetical protein LBS69_04075 [Prevotellaceae bacterium]|jgi:hypothetical protein|nr:hypothetical protein [Prevotellaceae bacterium]